MHQTKLIAGFPGVGKTWLSLSYQTGDILDLDSAQYSWASLGIRNPDFVTDYIEAIESNLGKYKLILISTHAEIRQALADKGIRYTLVYPSKDCKEVYMASRYIGRDPKFIKLMDTKWDSFIESLGSNSDGNTVILSENQYLRDVLDLLEFM